MFGSATIAKGVNGGRAADGQGEGAREVGESLSKGGLWHSPKTLSAFFGYLLVDTQSTSRAAGQEVSRETRTRLLHVYRELVGWANNPFDNQTAYTYWSRLHDLLSTLKGDWVLSQRFKQQRSLLTESRPHHDVAAFVYDSCTAAELFAFIELSFQVKELGEMLMEDSRDAIQSINQMLGGCLTFLIV